MGQFIWQVSSSSRKWSTVWALCGFTLSFINLSPGQSTSEQSHIGFKDLIPITQHPVIYVPFHCTEQESPVVVGSKTSVLDITRMRVYSFQWWVQIHHAKSNSCRICLSFLVEFSSRECGTHFHPFYIKEINRN